MSSPFTGTLHLEEIEPGRVWKIEQDLIYEVGTLGSGKFVIVPSGFVTDGASVPSVSRVFLAVWGTYGRAAVIHDYLYSLLRSGQPHPLAPDRLSADNIFLEAMTVSGTSFLLRSLMWATVRIFGGQYVKGSM